MKYIFVLIFFISSLKGSCQTDEKYFDYKWEPCKLNEARFYCIIVKTDSGFVRKNYFISEKSLQMQGKYDDIDCKIANGYFRFFHSNKNVESEGMYVKGKKNGLWLSFHSNGMMKDSIYYLYDYMIGTSLSWHSNGYISDSTAFNIAGRGIHISWFDNGSPSIAGLFSAPGKKTGKWKYFHMNGNLSSIEIYNEGTFVDKTYFDEEGIEQSDTINRDRNAMFPGGHNAWNNYLLKKIYFPRLYEITNADTATVEVSFVVNEDGKVIDVFVSTPLHPKFDRIVERAILKSPNWEPAIKNNRKVKFWIKQPITFSYRDEE